MSRKFNFGAGPATMPEIVLKEAIDQKSIKKILMR